MQLCKFLTFAIAVSHLTAARAAQPANPDEQAPGKTLFGRVEAIEQGADPSLPDLKARTEEQELPPVFKGRWLGRINIKRMETFDSLHADEPYCLRLLQEIKQFFHQGQSGRLVIEFGHAKSAKTLKVFSSDVHLSGGVRVQLTAQQGPALVPGGINIPKTVTDYLTILSDEKTEQTRVDKVTIVDRNSGAVLQRGFTEVSALYRLKAPKRMDIKILNIDYDENGRPLWKVLMTGEASR